MKHTARSMIVAGVIAASGLLGTAGTALAATPGELNLSLENDCGDLQQQQWQPGPDECVQLLQQDLNLMGASVAEDGFFGQQTEGALLRFQSSFGMEPSGVADAATRHSLQEDVDAKQATDGYDPNAGPDSFCDTVSGSGILGKLGDVLAGPCKIITDTGTAN